MPEALAYGQENELVAISNWTRKEHVAIINSCNTVLADDSAPCFPIMQWPLLSFYKGSPNTGHTCTLQGVVCLLNSKARKEVSYGSVGGGKKCVVGVTDR